MTSRPSATAGDLGPEERAELSALLNTLADDSLSEAEKRRLGDLLDRGEPARRMFREFAALHASLHWDYGMLLAPGRPPRDEPDKAPDGPGGDRWPPLRRAAAVVAAALVTAAATLAAWLFVAAPAGPPRPAAAAPPLATVTQTRFLLPDHDERPLAIGQRLEAGRIAIGGGAVELTLRNGVVIVFEGPGELDLADDLRATLHDGNIVVRMPTGMQGFVVRTPTTDVLDLGTEFAVGVGPDNSIDVQVYDGAVITSASRRQGALRPPKRLAAGEAARFLGAPHAAAVPLAFRPERFVRELPADVGIPLGDPAAPTDVVMRQHGPARQAAIAVHRAPAGMAIDGRLDEWADAAGFKGTRDGTTACAEWADGRMMYDEQRLYIAAHVGDPLPLRSVIDPATDAFWGWRGGAVQVRLSTDRGMGWPARGNGPSYYAQRRLEPTAEQEALAANPRLAHLTMWLHAPSKTPCLTINNSMVLANSQTNPAGFEGAFVPDADGKGYTMEYAIPWTLLGCADDPPQSGDVLAAVWQVLWADAAGRLRREQMVEIRNPDEPLPIHVWERAATWGRAEYR